MGDSTAIPRRGPGRPPKYPWDEFEAEVARRRRMGIIPPGPLDYIPSGLVEEMLQWCQDEWGREPSRSTIQGKLSDLLKNSVE